MPLPDTAAAKIAVFEECGIACAVAKRKPLVFRARHEAGRKNP